MAMDEEGDGGGGGGGTNKTVNKKPGQVNEEIESIKPYRFRPFLLHINIAPFFASYLIWFIVWTQYFGIEV